MRSSKRVAVIINAIDIKEQRNAIAAGMRLKEVRARSNISQDSFGKIINLSQTTVSQYESGMRPISDKAMAAIKDNFGISRQWLKTGKGEMYYPVEIIQRKEKEPNKIACEVPKLDKRISVQQQMDRLREEVEGFKKDIQKLREANNKKPALQRMYYKTEAN